MRLSVILILLTSTFMTVLAADVHAQRVTIEAKATPMYQVFKQIERQTGYLFWYKGKMIGKNTPVTVTVVNVPLSVALDKIFAGVPFAYEIVEETIVVTEKPVTLEKSGKAQEKQPLTGLVIDENGSPLAGATVTVKGGSQTTMTDNEGKFSFQNIEESAVLVVSYIGYQTREVPVKDAGKIVLQQNDSKLDEVQVIAYGTTTKRLNTGSVGSISAKDIAQQPVSNPLAALSGKIPGLVVTQSSGVSGTSFSIQVRGRNSLAQGSDPLILIDGIPFAPQNQGINVLSSAITSSNGSSLSPFTTIDPAIIESIDVLKDADATAIYGSRGANGVILITTKKGMAGKTNVTARIDQGILSAPRGMELMNTGQYLDMRREAFSNSGITPTNANAPDLTLWDSKRNTDLQKDLTGNTGYATQAHLSLSGGGNAVQFLISGGYNRETNVLPGKQPNTRGNGNFSLTHNSQDRRLSLTLSGSFTVTKNTSNSGDLTNYAFLPPNIPEFFNSDGTLKWSEGGIEYENPYAYLKKSYEAKSNSFATSLNLSYRIMDGLSAKLLAGYNQLNAKDYSAFPKSSNSPSFIGENVASHGNNAFTSYNLEPQLTYQRRIWKGNLNFLAGATFHRKENELTYLQLQGFASEALMASIQAASTVSAKTDNYTDYRYTAGFARINYNINDKYLINLTGRRDGSSRFGPDNRFENFGAIGAAYLISSEPWMERFKPIISFLKLRGSYGVTGNDQIGDYQYLDSWGSYSTTYQGANTLAQLGLFNAGYGWERNVKTEAAVDFGFWNDKLLLSANYYRNVSDNQLVQYKLPYITGFANITRNLPAKVENTGWELQLTGMIIQKKDLQWSMGGNVTIPKNKLLEFPGLNESNYAYKYSIGYPLSLIKGYQSTGLDPATGKYTYKDLNQDGFLNTADYENLGSTDPKYYGGITSNFKYKGFELDVFADFRRQTGRDFLFSIYSLRRVGGTMFNQPAALLNHWTPANVSAPYEKYLMSATSETDRLPLSDKGYSDQSFFRLRNIAVAFNIPSKVMRTLSIQSARVYFQAQNLFTTTKTKGYNPETQQLYGLAPLRVLNLGASLTF
ncbi:SusC/RagA family TonB-linked outer membrane protein [Chryseobacterium sp. MHB01]|uniref:SusC/RagA family TonB-linked outer membrane protein n=1 Tax=Chryseobacterium sp. MHB01 TaxID=3109433 RepID=UPI002B002CA7|nr:SusC/RagA family TonB-linked outer membrane protein [Chryseobacterium sp. MHB01]MEA1849894.1 SusC/RagA family TonB-linked outer membrane protein [Chryseobacterium sp. MHB01]